MEMIKRTNKGFTLIELLAVIVILGLLMAIAIPSVTKYITESRKKTLSTTVGNYIGALVNDVNDLSYTFTGYNTIYAVPIECIALERGGTDPFGHWYQANNSYFAYVLVQYDDINSKYVYGFTFKDSAGYGLYPTIQSNINEKGTQVKTGYTINKPVTGDLTSLVSLAKWQESGFKVDSNTHLQVLVATGENETGDGINTCTLQQKGDNYAQVEDEKNNGGSNNNQSNENSLANLIKKNNTIITVAPTLTTSIDQTSDSIGLYVSTDTNDGKPTYYFRGNVTNNYVLFAGLEWKIIRINEDGTVRLILNDRIDSANYRFAGTSMYYSDSNIAKAKVDEWYQINIIDKGYDDYIVIGVFCEQAKVKPDSNWPSENAVMQVYSSYTPNFKCATDGNEKGIFNSKVGLVTYDEAVHAGAYYGKASHAHYLWSGSYNMWTMSPAGIDEFSRSVEWCIYAAGNISMTEVFPSAPRSLRPVINLNANVIATGTGTSSDPYVVQTN